MGKNLHRIWIAALLISLFLFPVKARMEPSSDEEEITAFLNRLYDSRAQLLVGGDPERIKLFYFPGQAVASYAHRHELERAQYLQSWADKRGVDFVHAKSILRIHRIKKSGDTAKISLIQSLKVSYVYLNDILPPQSFGIGTRHALTIKKVKDEWFVEREWYLDPLEENPKLIPESDISVLTATDERRQRFTGQKYNREKAIAYANKYAGTAWGAGNNNRYNKKYRDYTGLGGDCTNFASQVLGDPEEGGGLRMRESWRYFFPVGGSQTWVQTDAFKNFLIRSGYGRVIASGTFQDVVRPTERYPHGAVSELVPGDLIAYVMNGDVDHFAILVGFDDKGYPLVNCHTADRYRVPFDLGWDKNTRYLLIHMND